MGNKKFLYFTTLITKSYHLFILSVVLQQLDYNIDKIDST
ncbi:hypothetical protein PPEP_a3428 [Pseudoalteromonas peptidolytica F12-50-A1]|uniref:Uncharacterized protein n=1 Tax=Pseudoalteromonas peptidolytica F12-50-A1 TaxID=1315280 RepID=A0A8I0MSN2_9GAMM|nr:hypothetical protein [Pseudoalteromonas peptidolytica F12-50-A1]